MKNEKNPAAVVEKESKQKTKTSMGDAEREVVRKDGIKAEQNSPMTNGNQHRSMNVALPRLERRRDIF